MTVQQQVVSRTWSLAHVTLGVLALAALLFAVPSLERGAAYLRLAYSYQAPLDGQEGMALWEASLLRSGQGLYVPLEPRRFVSAPYPPIHPSILAIVGDLPGPTVFTAGRLVSLVAAICALLCGFALVRRVSDSTLGALAAAVLLASFVPLQIWAMRIKPDVTGLAFTLAGLWMVALAVPSRDLKTAPARMFGIPPTLIAAAVLFVLAHFTKQTMVAAPLATVTVLLFRRRDLVLRWGILYVVLLAAVWIGLDVVTHGQYTYHVWTLHKLPWTVYRATKFVSELADAWPLIILASAGMLATLRRPTVISTYLLWAPASLIGAGVVGSNHNHLLETGAALALAGGQSLGLGLRRGGLAGVLAPALLALQLWVWRDPAPSFMADYRPERKFDRFVDFVRSVPGEVLSDEVGLLYAAGRPIPFDDPAAMGPASELGLWDAQGLIDDIRRQRFAAILLRIDASKHDDDNTGRWTPEMLHAVRDAYQVKFKDTMVVFVPKATGASSSETPR